MADTIRQSTIAINLNIDASQLKKFNEQLDELESSGSKIKSLADNASKAFKSVSDKADAMRKTVNSSYSNIIKRNEALSSSLVSTGKKIASFSDVAEDETKNTSKHFSEMSESTRKSLSEIETKVSSFDEKVANLSKDDGKVDKGYTGITDKADSLKNSLSSKYEDIGKLNTNLGTTFTELRSVVDDQFTGIDNRISNSANVFGKYANAYSDLVKKVSDNEKAINSSNSNIAKSSSDLNDKVQKNLQKISKSYDNLSDKGSGKLKKSLNGIGENLDLSSEHLRTFVNTNATLQAKWREDNSLTARSNNQLKTSIGRMTYGTTARSTGGSSTSSTNNTSGTPVIDEDKAKRGITVTQQLNRWGRTLIKTGRDMSITSLGLGASFLSGAKDASEIQHQMQMVSNLAVSSGEKQSEVQQHVKEMTKENTELSLKYGVAQTDLAKGDEQLVRAGYSTNQALATHKIMVEGAIASNQSYGDVMNNVTNILDEYKMRTKSVAGMQSNTNKVMNEMAYAVDHGKASFNDFGEAMKYAGATAHSTNQDMSQIMADITTLSKNGMEGSQAGTSLRKIMNDFSSPNTSSRSQQGPAMQALGLTPNDFRDAKGNIKQISDLFGLLKQRMDDKGYNQGQRVDFMHRFFGTTAQEAALLLEKNLGDVKSLNDQIAGSTKTRGKGYVEWLSGKNMNTATNQIKVFQQAWKAFGIGVATTVLPSITGIVKWLDKLLLTINGWSDKTKTFVAWGAIVVAGIAPVAIVIGSIIQSIKALTAVTKFFNHPVKNLFKDSVKANDKEIQNSNDATTRSFERMNKEAQKANETVNANAGGNNNLESQTSSASSPSSSSSSSASSSASNTEKTVAKDAEALEKSGANESSAVRDLTAFEKFKSRFGGKVSTGTAFGKVGEAETVLSDAEKGSGLLSKIAGSSVIQGGSKMFAGLDIISSLTGLFGMNSHNAGKKIFGTAGSIGGTVAGGALGGPIGAGIGSAVVQWLGTNAGKMWDKSHKEAEREVYGYRDKSPQHASKRTQHQQDLLNKTEANEMTVGGNRAMTGLHNDIIGLTKGQKQAYSQANKQLLKENADMYSQMLSNATKANTKSQKADEDNLKQVKSMLGKKFKMNANSVKDIIKDRKDGDNADISYATKKITQLENAEKRGSSHISTYRANAIKAIEKLQGTSDNKQKKLYQQLADSTRKISLDQAQRMIKQSINVTDKEKSNADSAYQEKKKQLDKYYGDAIKGMRKNQDLNKQARDDNIKALEQQKEAEIKKARDARDTKKTIAGQETKNVISEAEKQNKQVKKQIDTSTGDFKFSWSRTISSISKTIGGFFHMLGGGDTRLHKYGRVTQSGRNATRVPGASNARALGGSVLRDEMALVNEQGPESAYNPKRGSFRFLGNGGPMITRLYAGEHVLTADETKRLTHGGYPRGTKLNGYAGGRGGVTSKMTNQVPTGMVHVMFDTTNIKDAEKMTQKSMDNVTAQVKRGYTASTKQSMTLLDQFQKASQDNWASVYKDTDKQTNKLSDDTTQTYSDMSKQVIKNLQSLHDQSNSITKDTVTDYGNIMDGLQKLAQKAMQDAIGQLNNGVSGINASLKEFGGNTQVLKPIRFATGSNGALDKDTLAMVNDATTGPRQEAIVRNEQVYLPQGQNAMLNLQKGDEVLNGTQTQRLLRMAGMQRFAKGTGVSDDRLREIAKNNAKDPSKAFDDEFESKANSDLGSALEQTLTGAIKSGMKGVGNNWSSSMWGMINNLINDSSGSDGSLYKAMRKYGEGHKYLMGASGPDEFDCSGLVQYALKHAFGISVPHFSGSIMGMTQKVSRDNITPGVTLVGNADHIGVMTDKDHYYSAFNQSIHPNILETPFNSSYFPGTPIFGNIGGVSTKAKSDDKTGGLDNLVKGELGNPAIKWIESHLASSADGAGGAQPSGDHMHWLKQAGFNESDFSNLNWLITKESGWNVHATNPSSGAYGIPQALPASKLASAGSDWRTNPITQLKWEKDYIKDRYGNVANAVAHEKSMNWYANGGWSNGPSIFGEVPGEPEVAINPKRPTADSLIQSAIDARVKYDPSSKLKAYANRGKAKENVKSMYDKAYQAVGGRKPQRRQAPIINIKQEFTFNGNVTKSDARAISNEVDRKTRRAIREEINSYMRDLDSQVFGQ